MTPIIGPKASMQLFCDFFLFWMPFFACSYSVSFKVTSHVYFSETKFWIFLAIFRDLKSGNVLVSDNLRAKITDFGTIRSCLARSMNTSRIDVMTTSLTDVFADLTVGVGTVSYMAPEAFLLDRYDVFKADVFSFGVILWELVTQDHPDLLSTYNPGYKGPPAPKIANLLQEGYRLPLPDEYNLRKFLRCKLACIYQLLNR